MRITAETVSSPHFDTLSTQVKAMLSWFTAEAFSSTIYNQINYGRLISPRINPGALRPTC
jgi:hypothetical protein